MLRRGPGTEEVLNRMYDRHLYNNNIIMMVIPLPSGKTVPHQVDEAWSEVLGMEQEELFPALGTVTIRFKVCS